MNYQAARQMRVESIEPVADVPVRGTAVRLRGLTKRYGERTILDDVFLKIEGGQFTAVIGRSGCGKTTLLRLLANLETAEIGSIEFDELRHDEKQGDARVVFQEPRLLPWRTVIQNAALGLDRAGIERARQTLERVGLAGRENDWPAMLSGGQRQRVALARALVHEPRLLLLDEPFGALDALTRLEMQSLLEELWKSLGFTALIVTHDVGEAVMLADRVIVLDSGKIVGDVAIDLDRPRHRDDARIGRFESELLSFLVGH